jgi:hypothetical protein
MIFPEGAAIPTRYKSAAVVLLLLLAAALVQLGASVRQHSHLLLLVHPLLDLFRHEVEQLFYIRARLCASLEKFNAQLARQPLPLRVRHLSVLDVRFITDEHLSHVIRGVHFNLLHPVLDVLETLALVDGVGEYDAHGAAVVGLCDGLELLLASSVPYLQADLVLTDGDGLDFEVDADGGEVGRHEIILAKLQQHVRLPHSAVANHQQFYQVVVVLILMHALFKLII